MISKFFLTASALFLSVAIGNLVCAQETNATMAPVLVATRQLDRQALITAHDVKMENWPRAVVPEGVLQSADDAIGKRLNSRVGQGMPLVQSNCKNDDGKIAIPPGKKVVAIKLSSEDVIAGLLQPGDRVDVIGVYPLVDNGKKTQTTKTILRNVEVFSLKPRMSQASGLVTKDQNAVCGLLVSQEEAEQLYFAKMRSERFKLVLRGNSSTPSDLKKNDTNPINNTETIKQTREIARQLDQLAADLEDLSLYKHADGLRKSAHQLRLDVRD